MRTTRTLPKPAPTSPCRSKMRSTANGATRPPISKATAGTSLKATTTGAREAAWCPRTRKAGWGSPAVASPWQYRWMDQPWAGDACSLVDAFRRGERTPVEELEATLDAIDASDLNAFAFLDP